MKAIKKSLLILLSLALTQHVFSQAPNISYSPSSITVTTGVPFTLSPTNTGGAVPATTYGQVTTFAGSIWGTAGYVNATGTAARFSVPKRAAMDASGNLYVGDNANNAIRKITPSGVVTTFAGSTTGASGYSDATGTSALFNGPGGIAVDASGNLFVSDYNNDAIRKITPAGVVTTFYHSSSSLGPAGLSFDSSGNLLVAAQLTRQILKISPSGVVTVIAGDGNYGYINATGTAAEFANETDVKMDASGNLIVADYNNNAIRKISPTGVVTTLAGGTVYGNAGGFADGVGTAAKFNNPTGLAITSGGIIYVADLVNSDIRRIMPDGTVTLIAGSATQVSGTSDGIGTAATFNNPLSIYIDNTGTGYVCDMWSTVRKLVLTGYTLNGILPSGLAFDPTTGIISGTTAGSFPAQTYTITGFNASGYSVATVTLSGVPAPPPNISNSSPSTLEIGVPFSFSPTNTGGAVPAVSYSQATTFAGSTTAATGYTNGTGTAARFNAPRYAVGDGSGNLYVADGSNNAIRMVTAAGVVTTFAGSATGASGNTDATGTSALFNNPNGLAIDASGNLFVADYGNNSIRKITPSQVVSTFYHSTGTFGPSGLAFDGSGNLIVAAKSLNQILKITPAGVVTTIAGNTAGYVNSSGTSALFSSPADVKVDASGNLFVADYSNNAIREITPTGVVSTFAGSDVSGNTGSYADGVGTAARFNNPAGLAIAPGGIIYVTDLLNHAIRKIMPDGTVSLLAGSTTQTSGNADGLGTAATFNQPNSLYIDNTGTGYVTELAGSRLRKLALTGYSLNAALPAGLTFNATNGTVSGTPTQGFSSPVGLIAFNTGGFSILSLIGTQTFNWNGSTSNDWMTVANWTPATRVPSATDRAQIGVVAYTGTFQPIVYAASPVPPTPNGIVFGTFNSPVLTINSGQTLTTASTVSPGGLVVNASATPVILGPGNLVITGPSVINSTGSFTAAGNLVMTVKTAASATLTNNGTFALGSAALGTSASLSLGTSTTLTNSGTFIMGGPSASLTSAGSNTLTNSGSFTTGSNASISLGGSSALSNSGTFTTGSNASLIFGTLCPVTNSSTGTFTMGSSSLLTLGTSSTVTNNNNFTMGASSILTLGTSCTVTNNSTFTLASDATGSASIAAIPSTSSVNGQISVQRWITGNTGYRGYRLLSSPVYAATVGGINVYSLNYLQANTYLTGTDGTAGGFSTDLHTNPTLYIYRENIPDCNKTFICGPFQGIKNIASSYNYLLNDWGDPPTSYTQPYSIPIGAGYLFFWRGLSPQTAQGGTVDPYTSAAIPYAGAVQATGLLNQGNVTFHNWLDRTTTVSLTSTGMNGFNLVGNPYPSTIDWNTSTTGGIITSGVSTQISELNPATGSYGTYDVSGAHNNGASRYIVSGQGFFITATAAGASLTFTENAKVNQQLVNGDPLIPLLLSKSPVENRNQQYLRLEMNADTLHAEDVLFWFDPNNKTNFEPGKDAKYRLGFNTVSLSSLSADGVQLGIDKQPLPGKEPRVIALNAEATEDGAYHFKLREVAGIPKMYDIWLVDALKKDSVNLRVKNSYNFTISKGDKATFGDKRFSLVFNQNPALAYKLLDFTANKLQTARQVRTIWNTQNEENYTNFTVERSTDGGKTFEVLGGVKAAGEGKYSFIDKNPLLGLNQYRLKQEDLNNTISYSKIVLIEYTDKSDQLTNSKLTIYPNPAGSTINLSINAGTADAAAYKIRFSDAMGKVVKEVTSSQSSWQGNISNLLPGTYLIRVINNKTQSLVGESKFVKL